MSPPRTWPVRLGPLPGEALDSWLEAAAHRLTVPLNDLVRGIGLTGGAARRLGLPDRTIALSPAEARAIATAAGLDEASVHSMTLARYDQLAVILRPATRMVNVRAMWGRSQGSRYCPDCLAATGGRWQLRWRLSWSFACPAHQRLLADTCPGCGQPQRVCRSGLYQPPRPGYCTNPVHPDPSAPRAHVRCDTDLTSTATMPLPGGHPALHAQRLIDDLISTGTASSGLYATRPQPAITSLADLRAIAGRVIARTLTTTATTEAAADPVTAQIQALARAEHQHASARAKIRPGVNAPPTAAIAATGLTAACQVLAAADARQAATALSWVITTPRPAGRMDSPSTVDDWGRRTSPVLHAVQLAALAPRMRPTDQLRYRTASPSPREPDVPAAAAPDRATRIPALFWLPWTVRICPPAGILTVKVVRPALSGALLLTGTRLNLGDAADLLGSVTSSQDISKTVQLLHATPQWPDAAAALIRLAGYLDDHDIPVDYQQRRQLDYRQLLPRAEWLRLSRHATTMRDPGFYAEAARCMLFEQLSGMAASRAPFAFPAGRPWYNATTRLAVVLTPALASGLREAAARFLARQGITSEPVTWDPPAGLLDGLRPPGTSPGDIDIEHLHHLIRHDHITTATAARRLGTSRAAIELALCQHPAPETPASAKTRPKLPRQVPSRDQFAQYYLGEHMPLTQIAKRAGLSVGFTAQLARDYHIPVRGQKDYATHQHPVITRDWLQQQYAGRGRSLRDLASEIGMSTSAIRRWAKIYGIRAQTRYPIRMNITAAAAAAPPILRPAITGPSAWTRLHRLAAASRYPSLRQAATSLGIHPTALITQVGRLECELGQQLLDRAPGQRNMRPTAFGQDVIAAIRAAERSRNHDRTPPTLKKMPAL